MLNPFVSTIVYFCEMLIAYIFLSNLAERRYHAVKCLLIGICLFTICTAVNLISLNSVIANALVVPAIHFLFAFLCFRLKFYPTVFYSVILCTLCASLEFATIFAASALSGGAIKNYNNDPMLLVMELSLSKTIYFIISLLLSRVMKVPQHSGVVLDMPLLDTRQNRDLTGTLIADIVLQLLSYVAQTEREFIRQRQAEGIAAAKENGVRFGRSPMARPEAYDNLKLQWEEHRISARAAAKQLGITHRTFLKWVHEENG